MLFSSSLVVMLLVLLSTFHLAVTGVTITSSRSRGKQRTVHYGPSHGVPLNEEVLLIVGKHKHIKSIPFEQYEGITGDFIEKKYFEEAIKKLPESGAVPLYLNQAALISVQDATSRYNSPSNAMAIMRAVKSALATRTGRKANIVLLTEYADVLPNVAAIVRCFPLYTRRTSDNEFHEVNIDILMVDDKNLSDGDLAFLSHLINGIRSSIRLVDMPANEMTSIALIKEAIDLAESLGVNYTVVQGEDLAEQEFGGIYAVGKAGPTPPAIVVLSHLPIGAYETYAVVGKGVVFDTGGLSIKKVESMRKMKGDMAGAAGALESFATLVQSGFKQNLHAILCIAENSVGPDALKPDDIITALSGKTIEITNTDCEGRLMLADGVFYAKDRLKATTIIDMATMTDNSIVSGKYHATVLTNSDAWEKEICAAGRRSGDLLVPVVFSPELHFSDLKSTLADMVNCPIENRMGPSSALGGLFVGSHIDFGEGLTWIHIDLAFPELTGEHGFGFGPALFSSLFGNFTNVPLLNTI